MAPYIKSLMPGVSELMVQTNSYALPPTANYILTTVACELSPDNTTYVLTAGTTTGVVTAAGFMRCTTSTTCVAIVKDA